MLPESATQNSSYGKLDQHAEMTKSAIPSMRIYQEYLAYLFRKQAPPELDIETTYRDYLQVRLIKHLFLCLIAIISGIHMQNGVERLRFTAEASQSSYVKFQTNITFCLLLSKPACVRMPLVAQ